MPIRATPSCCSGLTGRYSCSGDRNRVSLRRGLGGRFPGGRSCLVAAGPTGQPIHRLFFRGRDVLDDSGYCDDQHGRHSVCRAGGHQPHGLSTLEGNVHQSPGQRWGGSPRRFQRPGPAATSAAPRLLGRHRRRVELLPWPRAASTSGERQTSFISSINLCKATSRSSPGWLRFTTWIHFRRQAS